MIENNDKIVFTDFGNCPKFNLVDLTEPRDRGSINNIDHSGTLLGGTYRVIKGEIIYRLYPEFQEQLGIKEIVFRSVEDYDPIDPHDWLPEFFPKLEDEMKLHIQ
jgi:hypothetical protein